MHELQTSPYAAEITAKKFLVRKIYHVPPKTAAQKFQAAALSRCQNHPAPRRPTGVGGRAPEVSPDSAQVTDLLGFSYR
jgi:hypothetical protein